jgi:hypothetical protein
MPLLKFRSVQTLAAALSLLLCCGPAIADPARVRIAGPLQAGPAVTAPATGSVKAGASVDIVQRKGFWARVKSGAQTGWLKLGRLSLGGGVSGNEIAALASGRTGSNNVVSASGGRGLDAADFERATPDSAAVSALSRSAASEASAAQFARSGGLKARKIEYIRAPQTSTRRSPR